MIVETVILKMEDKPLVCGIGLAGWGSSDSIRLQKHDNIYICGDHLSEVSDKYPPIAPRVGIVANMEANQVLEILMGKMK